MLLNEEIWQRLTGDGVRLPHALLFAGPAGVGKRELAEALAGRLLCESPREPHQMACGRCASCLMMMGGQHPDYRVLQPEATSEDEDQESAAQADKKKASRQIRIQQIRELEDFFHVGGHRGGARVCLIDPAEAMNPIAANSLLKILEEPSPSFYFIMISDRWHNLLPTLLSRAQRVMFARPSLEQSRRWLKQQQLEREAHWLNFFAGAPLELAKAARSGRLKGFEALVGDLRKTQDPLTLAARWEGLMKTETALEIEDIVVTLQKWLCDLGLCVTGHPPRYFDRQTIEPVAQKIALPGLLRAQQQVGQLRAWAHHPLNAKLFLEDLCMRALRPITV